MERRLESKHLVHLGQTGPAQMEQEQMELEQTELEQMEQEQTERRRSFPEPEAVHQRSGSRGAGAQH
jgi:hypothetical protein